jgi:transposase
MSQETIKLKSTKMAKQPVLRQCLGIDVSQKHLQVNLSVLHSDHHVRVLASTKFDNTGNGFDKMLLWINKRRMAGIDLGVVMEATGVYHESAAYFLHDQGLSVSVILPNKSKAYARSLNAKSKTDDIDAGLLARMGLERKVEVWSPGSLNMRRIKRLCRERVALQQQKTAVLNQLHAKDAAHEAEKNSQKRGKQLIQFLKRQIQQVEQDILSAVNKDSDLKAKVDQICSVKGLGLITVVTIIAETDGFALFKNKGQLVSFAGYDVVQHESGSSIKAKTRISKKGNKYIRRALHFPALLAVKHEPLFKEMFNRIFEKSFIKMKAYVAVQRKLLVLIYSLYKNDKPYDPDYHLKNNTKQNRQELSPA